MPRTIMKQYRYISLLCCVLLTCSAVQAQYLNFFGSKEQGSIPLASLDSISFATSQSGRPYDLTLYYDRTSSKTMSPTDVDSLTITEKAYFSQAPAETTKAYMRYSTSLGETRVLEMVPVWNKPGLYHALDYVPLDASNFAYSYDQQNWTITGERYYVPGEGWVQLVLDLQPEGYLANSNPLSWFDHRSSVAKRGFAYVTGSVTGDWADSDSKWKLSMPVNADGWWASPRFAADGEVRAYVKVNDCDWWNTEFTIHNGKLFWRDSDIPNSWAANKGNDYSVQGKAGQKLYVNFTTGEAMVSTPDEVPFPLENPVLRSSNTVATTADDPTLCNISNGNTANLYWNSVDGASGYRIKMALMNNVSTGGAEVWEKAENILLDTTVDANTTQLSIPGLNYMTNYRFSIQALSPRGEQYNSAWFGYGNARYWYAYLGLTTDARYEVPQVVSSITNITGTTMRVNLNPSIAEGYTAEQQATFREHFNFTDAEKTQLRVDYITVEAHVNYPDAVVPAKYAKYQLSEEDLTRGYVDVEGLSEGAMYLISAWDETITSKADARYNTVAKTTKSAPEAPVLITHVATESEYNSMALDGIINEYMQGAKPENQEFRLEGGKTYHISANVELYKGITIRTNPEDLAMGKRAKLYMMGEEDSSPVFILGRTSVSEAEQANMQIDIDQIRFLDLDIEAPKAKNNGDGGATANYFINMYSNGLGINVNLIEWNACTFQGFIRGFFRTQGSNQRNIHNLKLIDSDFYNCGYFSANGGGYGYFYADAGSSTKANLLENMEVSGCVIYNSPMGNFINSGTRNVEWDGSVRWNINVHHNTFVNFATIGSSPMFLTRCIPGGSALGFHDNIVILTKDNSDEKRTMNSTGWDARNILGGDGTGVCTFNIYNNWTTNDDYLTKGQPFSNYAFDATSNAPGKWKSTCTYPAGTEELTVHQEKTLKATDLMASPNPKNFIGSSASPLDYHTDNGIDGLYYQQTDAVKNSDIYKSGAGCQRLVNGK